MNLDLYSTFLPRVSVSLIWALLNIPFAIRVLKMASFICMEHIQNETSIQKQIEIGSLLYIIQKPEKLDNNI
jgi:hypothetical protein